MHRLPRMAERVEVRGGKVSPRAEIPAFLRVLVAVMVGLWFHMVLVVGKNKGATGGFPIAPQCAMPFVVG